MTTASEHTSTPTAAAPGPSDGRFRAPKRMMFGIALANFGLWLAFFTPVIATLQLRMAELFPEGGRELALSLLLAVGGTAGIIVTPLAGRLSDRTTSRMGMRRPWLIAAAIVGLVGVALEATSDGYVGLLIGGALAQVGFAGAFAVLLALLPDHVPVNRRGIMGSLFGFGQALGIVVGIVLGGVLANQSIAAAFLVPGILGVLSVGVLCVILPDRRLRREDAPALSFRKIVGSFWVNPVKHPDFGWAWISRFAIFMAFASVVNYQVFFLQSQLHVPLEQTAALVAAGTGAETLMVLVFSFLGGIISDRVGRRKPFVVLAAVIGMVGLAVLAFATAVPMFILALSIIGVASGIYYSVDIALVTQVLPDVERDAGKDLGVITIANQLPQTLAPAVAPIFLAVGFGSVVASGPGQNYTALFAVSALFALISALSILKIRSVR